MKNLKYLKRYALFLLVVVIGVCTNVYAQETIISYTVTCSGSNQKSMVYKTEAEARAYFKSCKTGVYLTPRYFYDLTKTSSSSAKSSASSSSSSKPVSSSSSSAVKLATVTFIQPTTCVNGEKFTCDQIDHFELKRLSGIETIQKDCAAGKVIYSTLPPAPGETFTVATVVKSVCDPLKSDYVVIEADK